MDDNYDTTTDLPSVRDYNRFDDKFVGKGDEKECKTLYEQFDSSYPYQLCMRLSGKLNHYDELKFSDYLNEHKCKYLNLWIYDRLSKLKGEEYKKTHSLILKLWGSSKTIDECNTSLFLNNYPCTTKISQYIDKIRQLYRDVTPECQDENNFKPYCNAFRDINKIYREDQLLNLQCKEIKDEVLSDDEDEEKHEKAPYKNPSPADDHAGFRGGDQGPLNKSSREGGGHAQPRDHIAASPSSPEQHATSLAGYNSKKDFQKETPLSLESPKDSTLSDTPKTTTVALPALSVLSLGFMIYKFTAVGPKVRNLFGNRGKYGINSHTNLTYETLEGPYKYHENSDLAQRYIGYQST
ncbi:PIR protein [Plasmodium vivax]|uniref:VIR protein n=1 Tax=Plasmodium vivax TaxID=5855 RepID=A0A564ZXZ4_PLAVI|nr:PIR protein [Plasmodium vivax]